MYWLKACHKCSGDLYQEPDIYGSYYRCLQCGRYSSKEELAPIYEPLSKEVTLEPGPIELEGIAA